MAPKRPVIEQPPPADSSSEEEQERSEENDAVEEDEDEENDAVEEGGEEEEESESPVKKSTVAASSDDDDDDDDDGSGSDSDDTQPSPTASDFTIKPIVTAKPPPIDDVTKPKKPASKPSTSATKSGSKRPAPEPEPDPIEPESKNKNKKKKVAPAAAAAASSNGGGDDNEEAKKGSGNQRVWSEDDEVALLKGMSEYRTLKGSVPSADMSAFYEFIKKSMHFDLSKNQLVDKIRRLRKKYLNNVQKGEDPVFSKPHEHRAFVLSKKIWGAEANGNDGVVAADSGKTKKKAKQTRSGSNNGEVHTTSITLALPSGKNPVLNLEAKANGDGEAKAKANGGGGGGGGGEEVRVNNGDGEEKGDFWSNYPCLNGSLETGRVLALPEFGKCFLRERMSLIGNNKAEELEEKWRDLQEEELKLYLKRVDLVKQQAELALETLRASRS